MTERRFVEVAVPVPLAKAFTYELPEALASSVQIGSRVLVPFGRQRTLGVVLGFLAETSLEGLKPITRVVDEEPVVPAELLSFLREVAAYYFAPIGEVLRLALPAVEKRREEQGVLLELTAGSAKRTRKVDVQQELVVSATSEVEEPGKLRGQAALLLAELRANGPRPIASLREKFSNARAAVDRLVELGLAAKASADKRPRDRFRDDVARDEPPVLTLSQQAAVEEITASFDRPAGERAFLLFGVTGSGKTEVYLRAISVALARGRGALVLVPEIALTPQLVNRYRQRFGDDVAVLHSGLADRQRHEMFLALRAGTLRVAIGARSALFGPVPELGLLIVDEEHDGSFKQEEGVRYHARDMAMLRAHRAGATIVLGSATPSIESFELSARGKVKLLELPDRAVEAASLPAVTVVDLKAVKAGPSGTRLLTTVLHREIDAALARREQTILFLNRRGHSPAVVCTACGVLVSCKACSVAMTFHRGRRSERDLADGDPIAGGSILCHYCGYQERGELACPGCGSRSLLLDGLGTEKLEETIAASFPGARVARLDRDIADTKKGEAVLAGMRDGTIDVLVGTQMVTKGHDFPAVTLVGVVNADAALGLPEFRAGERAFQLLVQVAGRAGRHEKKGKVIVQTYSPEHPAIAFARKHDVRGFLEHERADRKDAGYPPFRRLALLRVDALDLPLAQRTAEALSQIAREAAAQRRVDVEVLPPTPAPLARLRGRYRYRVLIRSDERGPLRQVLALVESKLGRFDKRARVVIDVDPVSMM